MNEIIYKKRGLFLAYFFLMQVLLYTMEHSQSLEYHIFGRILQVQLAKERDEFQSG